MSREAVSREAVSREAGRADRRSPVKRAVILHAATDVFLRKGYSRASVDLIAEEAGVSKRTVYNHFADKERLFHEVVVTAHRDMFAAAAVDLDDLLTNPDVLPSELVTLGHRLVELLVDERLSALRRLIIAEVAFHPSIYQACRDGLPAALGDWLSARFLELTALGALTAADPAVAARQYFGLVAMDTLSMSGYGTTPISSADADRIVTNAVEMFLRAYGVRA